MFKTVGGVFNNIFNSICYEEFAGVLQYIPNNTQKIKTMHIIENKFIQDIIDISKKYNNKLIVSLSGGVDSMVLLTILYFYKIDVIAVHVNYNNRKESVQEQQFLQKWCDYNKIPFYVKSIHDIKRNNTNRTDYERITKQIKFDFYKEVMGKENASCVLLAHHKDDIVENIFANICRGRNILDLSVIKKVNIINDICVCRPMINYYKADIYKFAQLYQVPYFKDSTPTWSVRGKFRNVIYPSIEDTFTKNIKENLVFLDKQASGWNEIIEKEIISKFMKQVHTDNLHISFNVEMYINYPFCFWNLIFMKLFNQYGKRNASRKSIQSFMTTINNLTSNKEYNIVLTNESKCYVKNNMVYIHFIYKDTLIQT